MKVAVDLVWLADRAGGIGRYARELIGAMVAGHPDVALELFVARDHAADLREEPWASEVRWTELPLRFVPGGRLPLPWHLAATHAVIPTLAQLRRCDVVHGPANAAPLRRPGLPVVGTLHDLIWLHHADDWGTPEAVRAMWRTGVPTLRRADRVICDSAHTAADAVAQLGLDPARLDVALLGVRVGPDAPATPEHALRARLQLGDGPVLLCVAQKRRYKRQDALIRAVAALERDDVRLVLPGAPTPFEAELRALADDLGVAHRVVQPDWVSEEDLEGLYRLARGFVLPSLYEGFGLPVLEAMARGVPTACSDRTALPEFAGDAALLFDPMDQAAVDGAVARLVGDDALCADLARRGPAQAARFGWERTAEATVESYRRAISARRR